MSLSLHKSITTDAAKGSPMTNHIPHRSYQKKYTLSSSRTGSTSLILGRGIVAFLFLFLLLQPQTALEAVRDGLLLWYHSVLPVLFPFMILSGLIVRLHLIEQLPSWLFVPLQRLFRCSRNGCFAVLAGFLCGFPMGARITHDLHMQNMISDQEAGHLYGFVNNVSPAFVISFLASECVHRPDTALFFLFCILGASFLYGILTRPKEIPADTEDFSSSGEPAAFSFLLVDTCIWEGVRHTVKLGAYITLFSLITAAATCLLPPHGTASLIIPSCLEVTNGVLAVSSCELPFFILAPLLCAVCAFGGLSAFAQTISIASMDSTLAFQYLKSRVTVTLLAALLSCGVLLIAIHTSAGSKPASVSSHYSSAVSLSDSEGIVE